MMKRVIVLCLIVFVCVIGGVYSLWPKNRTDVETSSGGQQIAIALEDNPTSMDPIAGSLDVNSYPLVVAGHAPLSLVDGNGELIMVIAESIEVSDDGLRCDIAMNPGARFWDGSPVNAADVKYSFERVWQSQHPHRWVLQRIRGAGTDQENSTGLSGIEVLDDHHLAIHFDLPDPDFPFFISTSLTSVIKAGTDSGKEMPLDQGIIGCGPFRPASLTLGDEFVFIRNEGFTKPSRAESLVLRVIDNPQQRLQAFHDGQVDLIRLRGPMIAEAAQLTKNGLEPIRRFQGAQIVRRPANELTFVVFNWKSSKLSTIPIEQRQAVLAAASVAWPRQEIAERFYLGAARPVYGVVPPIATVKTHPPLTASDVSPSLPNSFSLLTPNDPDSRRLASAIRTQLVNTGWSIKVQNRDLNQLVGQLLEGDYTASVFWIEQAIPAGPIPWMMFFDPKGSFVKLGQPIEGVGAAIEQARSILDPTQRSLRYQAVVDKVNQEQTAFLPLLSREVVLMKRPNIQGVFLDQNGVLYFTFLTVAGEDQ